MCQKSLPDLIYLGFPDGCASATNGSKCNTYLRMAPNLENDSFIDFYLEGNLQGWVAVGFSKDKFMVYVTVISVSINIAVQTYNLARPARKGI